MSDINATIIILIFILAGYFLIKLQEYNPMFKEDHGVMSSAVFFVAALISLVVVNIINSHLKGRKAEKTTDIQYHTNDLYFIRTNENNDSIHYHIKNNIENGTSWSSCCILKQGKLYSFNLDTDKPIEVIQNNHKPSYKVKEDFATLGEIVFINNGFTFKNNQEIVEYKAILDTTTDEGLGTAADFLLALEFGNSFSSSITTSNFVIKNQNEEIVAKYYVPLKNLDLSFDIANQLDLRIAAVFGMIFDIMSNTSLKSMQVSENK
ncbi:MAG: hypothetical protein E6713_07805 [Sporomusaceae bacterium]|nr:hypothetical protein [Sporomusaceae bacterium]